MSQICVPIPSLQTQQTIELEVTINGKKHLMNYRVESVDVTNGGEAPGGHIDRLRTFISKYDADWELVQIGIPSGDLIPVMFRQRARSTQTASS